MRAHAPIRMPQQFNLKFNQNLTRHGSEEENFSYFSNVEEEGSTDLGNYFSDDEEDDNWDEEDLSSESDPWSHTDFYDPENFPNPQHTPSDVDAEIFGLETINEARFEDDSEANKLHHISGLSEETKLAFSTWRPFIPPEHAFRNCAARSQPSGFSSQASSSQEPTLIQISMITTSTKLMPPPMKQISPQPETSLSQPKDWPSFKPATRPFTRTWTKLWTESTKTYNGTKNWRTEFPDHPEPSEQYKHWKQQLQCSIRTNQNQITRLQNTPLVNDAGSEPQVCTQWKSHNSSTTKYRTNTTKIKYWVTKWRKCSNKIQICRTKFWKPIGHLRTNSKRTPLWLWLPRRWPPTCSSGTTTVIKDRTKQPNSPRGRNHFSKRKSESESYSKCKSINERHRSKSKDKNLKSESKGENKDIKVRNENKLVTFSTDAEAKVTAKADEVKAIKRHKQNSGWK